MKVNARLTFDQFRDLFTDDYDRVDFMEDHVGELFETGSVTVQLGDAKYEICLTVDRVFY